MAPGTVTDPVGPDAPVEPPVQVAGPENLVAHRRGERCLRGLDLCLRLLRRLQGTLLLLELCLHALSGREIVASCALTGTGVGVPGTDARPAQDHGAGEQRRELADRPLCRDLRRQQVDTGCGSDRRLVDER
jgi:hypothetical protein